MAKPHLDTQPVLSTVDPIWTRVRAEAEDIVRREPELASFIFSTVLHHERLEQSVVHRIAERLDHSALSGDLIRQAYDEALRDEPDIGNAFRADLVAVFDRDPATSRFIDPLLYFKGFHALQTPRHSGASSGALALAQGPQGFRLLHPEPLVGRVPDRYQSGRENRPRHFPRSCHRPRGWRDRGDRG